METVLYVINGANQIATACTDVNTNDVCDTGETQVTYQHDAYGNLTNDGRYEYVYDVTNNLTELKVSEQTVATSVYNGDGDLVSATMLETTTTYVRDWASPEKIVLVETTGTNVTRNLYGLGLIAQQLPDSSVQYALFDGMRSIRQFVDADGAVTYTQTFDPFGGLYASAGGNNSAYGFMSLQGLEQSPLLYYNGQWYHTGTGRFVQPQKGIPNPYVPLMGLSLLGFGLFVSPRLRKKKWGVFLLMLLLVSSSGMVMVACGGGGGGTIPPGPPDTSPSNVTHTMTYRLTSIDWESIGAVRFLPGPWGNDNQDIVLLALDMIYRATNNTKTPETVGKMVEYGGTMEIEPLVGTTNGGKIDLEGSRKMSLYAADKDSLYVSSYGIKTVVHEFGHGIDRWVAIDRGLDEFVFSISATWTGPLGYVRCENVENWWDKGA